MNIFRLVRDYLGWHYSEALGELGTTVRDLWFFLCRFFSVSVIAGSLLAPWHHGYDHDSLSGSRSFFSNFILSGVMHFLGFLVRIVFLLCSSFIILFATILIPMIFLLWFVLPFIFTLSLFLGLYLLFY